MLPFKRLCLAFALAVLPLLPMSATALSVMDPFNLEQAMDAGAVKMGDGVAYADGPRKKLDVYVPKNPEGPAPVVFFIYGGGWKNGDRADYAFVGQALASRGFVTVIADYRLVPEVKYPEFLEDNAQALRWVQDNIATYGGDTARLFIAGHSAGAYGAVMIGLDRSFFREYGITMPVRGIAALSGPYDFYPFEYDEVRVAFGEAPNPEGTQPVNLVTPESPPMYLASGTTDPIVRVENTVTLAQKLKAQNVWVTERYYEGFGHMEPVFAIGSLWRWRAPVLEDMVEFFYRFGAFPSGVPYAAVTPNPPEENFQPMSDIIAEMDKMLAPVD